MTGVPAKSKPKAQANANENAAAGATGCGIDIIPEGRRDYFFSGK